jgi:hypothetical protein
MSESEGARDLIDARRRQLQATVGRPLRIPQGTPDLPLSDDRRAYLLGEAKDLYWNDLEWENVTGEEEMDEGNEGMIPDLVFPGFLAFVRGLLVTEVPDDSLAGPAPRPEVVENLLEFLARRTLELRATLESGSGDDRERLEGELQMTSSVLDRVLLEVRRHPPQPEANVDRVARPAAGRGAPPARRRPDRRGSSRPAAGTPSRRRPGTAVTGRPGRPSGAGRTRTAGRRTG